MLRAAFVLLTLAAPAAAQQSPILTVDQDRLFAETRIGSEALTEFEAGAAALAAENARIEAELVAQERDLTERRPTMDPAAFRAEADAFDARVQSIRAEQDEKARILTETRDAARQSFFAEVGDVLSEIVRERGALLVLDRRDVVLSADQIDITAEAVRRLNEGAAGD